MDAFGIFEGGGAKGLAHVGALSALEKLKVNFKGVGGTSAGAIVAALIAAGYKSKELFNIEDPNNNAIYSVDFLNFFEPKRWEELSKLGKDLPKLQSGYITWSYLKLGWYSLKHRSILKVLRTKLGLFDTAAFEEYLDEALYQKLKEKKPVRRPILFDDVDMPVKIVAADITNAQVVVFSKEICPYFPVSKAVAASVNLPIIFYPQLIKTSSFKNSIANNATLSGTIQAIDGGVLSNFPAWIFDKERSENGPHIPTFGFRLVQDRSSLNERNKDKEESRTSWYCFNKKRDESEFFLKWVRSLIGTILDGDPILETREIENLHEIPLKVKIHTLDFNLDSERKKELFLDGYNAAQKSLNAPYMPKDRESMEDILKDSVDSLKDLLGLPDQVIIRANIVTKTTRGNLRVTYTFGMNNDADDRLEFVIGSGASSRCWLNKEPVICDLEAAKKEFESTWAMNKYQQALVRADLKSLMSYPILYNVSTETEPLAVLNIDSPQDLLEEFSSPEVDKLMIMLAETISKAMCKEEQNEIYEN